MDKLPMCRICLVQNVNMYVVVNKNLHELYEKLTDIPFVTKDSRPILACFFCYAKLKQCFRLLRKCLEAEELFSQMMNDVYEPKPSISQDDLHCCTGFIKSPIVHISIVDGCETDSIAIKEELPDICERQDYVIEPKKEYQSDDLDLENQNNTCLGTEDIPPHLSVSDSGRNVKIEVEEELELSKKKRRAVGTSIVSDEYETDSIAIKEEVPAICERQDYVIEPKEEYQSDDLDLENLNNSCLSIEDIRHLSESDSGDDVKIEVDEEQELSKKKRRAVETNRAPFTKKPKLDSQRTRLEDTMTMVELKKTEHSNLEAIRTTKNVTSKQGSSVKESSKCDQRRRKADIKKHFRTHTGDKPYKCEVCQRSFIHKINLTAHEKTHTGVKPYQCDVCQRSYSTKINLTKHIRIHTGENPYKCEVCQRSFSQKSNLTAHVRIHTGEKPYQCDVCQRSYTKKTNLTKHIRIHTGENPYQCDICQRSFSIEGHLTAHNRIHTGENPHQCDICQRSFSVRSSLTKHIRIHTGEKPHQCNVCQRSFSEKSSLTKHFRIHTGEKPHKCEVCQRSFSERGSLTKHMRIHTGHKPFKCECRFCKL